MRKFHLVTGMQASLLAAVLVFTQAQALKAHAQETGQDANANTRAASAESMQARSPEQMVQRLGEKLNLTDDQKQQITPILAERQQKLQELRADTSMRRRRKARRMKSIMEESDKKIEKVLNEEQRKQYAELKQQMREQMKERRKERQTSN